MLGANEADLVLDNLLHSLDEVSDDALALAELSHAECAQLVQLHDSRHGGEDDTRIKVAANRVHSCNDLFRQQNTQAAVGSRSAALGV